uniref:NADH-ubiquinone oxidoreductase chain 4L n=1 Tax=Pseudocellus pearsei TaxID=58148 RepID=A9LI81_9ARAC|nr:NADH dehydrogenase subunit 4L [Pseudocellus pearsei]ABS71912.1 NADH dehydrogenase subunit 4L [Pseudocellus pearsei]
MEIWLCLYFYLCGLVSLIIKSDHVLLMLMSLEFMSVVVFLFLFCCCGMMVGQFYLILFFLVIVVCEGVLGLSLLVGVVRSFGNDMIYCVL